MESIHNYNRLEHLNSQNLNWFVVNWCLGNTCNYSCSYCPVNLHNGTKKWHATDRIKMFIEKIKACHPEKNIYFEFTGGEVTLNPDFIDICKFCTESGVKVGFISNGSRTLRWWQENLQFFDSVLLSFHGEHANPDHFCNVIETLHNNVRTHANVMMAPDLWDQCLAVAYRIKDIGNCSIALQPLIKDLASELYDYTAEQQQIFARQHELIGQHVKYTKHFDHYRGAMKTVAEDGTSYPRTAHSFIGKNTNNWRGWECWSGVEQLIVDMDGSVWRGWCRIGGAIGHITDDNLILPTQPVTCTKNLCHCNYDIMSTKIRLPGGT